MFCWNKNTLQRDARSIQAHVGDPHVEAVSLTSGRQHRIGSVCRLFGLTRAVTAARSAVRQQCKDNYPTLQTHRKVERRGTALSNRGIFHSGSGDGSRTFVRSTVVRVTMVPRGRRSFGSNKAFRRACCSSSSYWYWPVMSGAIPSSRGDATP